MGKCGEQGGPLLLMLVGLLPMWLVLVSLLLFGIFFFWSSQLEVIGEGEVGEQVVSEGRVCDVPAKTGKGRARAWGLHSLF